MRMFFSYMKARALLMLRAFPALLAFALCLALCASIALSAFIGAKETDDGQMRVRVGIAGSLEDTYIELGMFALKNMDTSRYYVEFVELDLERAKRALSDGELLGYLVIPEGFADAALGGEEVSLEYVCADSPSTFLPILMKEIVDTVSGYVTQSQNGVYGFMQFMRDNGYKWSEYSTDANLLALEYMRVILDRGEIWERVEVESPLVYDTVTYYVCAAFVFLLLLFGVCASFVMIREDTALLKIMKFKGCGAPLQLLSELLPYFALMWVVAAILILGAIATGLTEADLTVVFAVAPAVLCISLFQFFMYEISRGVIGGAFLQLFSAVALSFVSGFFFPFNSLPPSVCAVARYLPTRVAFEAVASSFSGQSASVLPALMCAAVLFVLTVGARGLRTGGHSA